MAGGYSFESFGALVGVCADTLYNWVKAHREFFDAKKRGILVSMHFWENMMVMGMRMPSFKWTPSVAIFNMKCRFPNQFRDDPRALEARRQQEEEEAGGKKEEIFTADW